MAASPVDGNYVVDSAIKSRTGALVVNLVPAPPVAGQPQLGGSIQLRIPSPTADDLASWGAPEAKGIVAGTFVFSLPATAK